MKRTLTAEDIMPNAIFCEKRDHVLHELKQAKKNRRIEVGPDATFYFENHLTLWWQIQEMLRIEKGGEEQLKDELSAYQPLLPRRFDDGTMELVATFMIEIDDLERRFRVLSQLGGIEQNIWLHIGDQRVQATPEGDIERTDESGKTSAVHFLRFRLNSNQIELFHKQNQSIILNTNHNAYTHKTTFSEEQREAIACDLT